MSEGLVAALAVAYILCGIGFDLWMREEHEPMSPVILLLWPLWLTVLVIMVVVILVVDMMEIVRFGRELEEPGMDSEEVGDHV